LPSNITNPSDGRKEGANRKMGRNLNGRNLWEKPGQGNKKKTEGTEEKLTKERKVKRSGHKLGGRRKGIRPNE